MPQPEHPISVYVNPHGDVVLRQQGPAGDQIIILPPKTVPDLVGALEKATRTALYAD